VAWVRAGGKRQLSIGPLQLWLYFNMTSGSSQKARKKRGRPATGRDPVTALRLAPVLKFAIEDWAKRQSDKPKRSEAIRRLLEFALASFMPSFVGKGSALFVPNVSDQKKPLISAQIRAARALIRWNAEDLARQSAVSLRTIRRAELVDGQTSMTAANDLAIRRALEEAGVEFTNLDQPGVRLSKAAASPRARSGESGKSGTAGGKTKSKF
jgi:hypothetical protein